MSDSTRRPILVELGDILSFFFSVVIVWVVFETVAFFLPWFQFQNMIGCFDWCSYFTFDFLGLYPFGPVYLLVSTVS